MPVDDETLMALADGELSPELAREVAAEVGRDPELAARLRRFSETRRLLVEAAHAAPAPSVDPALIARIRAARVPAAIAGGAPNGRRSGLWARLAALPRAANLNLRPYGAVAAGFALALVAVGWYGMQPGDRSEQVPAVLASLLDELPSGERRVLDDGTEFTMISSYRNAADELCREYEMHGRDAGQVQVSCHDAGQGWTTRFSEALVSAEEGYRTASGSSDELDRFLQDSGAGAPLTQDEELSALTALAESRR